MGIAHVAMGPECPHPICAPPQDLLGRLGGAPESRRAILRRINRYIPSQHTGAKRIGDAALARGEACLTPHRPSRSGPLSTRFRPRQVSVGVGGWGDLCKVRYRPSHIYHSDVRFRPTSPYGAMYVPAASGRVAGPRPLYGRAGAPGPPAAPEAQQSLVLWGAV